MELSTNTVFEFYGKENILKRLNIWLLELTVYNY